MHLFCYMIPIRLLGFFDHVLSSANHAIRLNTYLYLFALSFILLSMCSGRLNHLFYLFGWQPARRANLYSLLVIRL